MSRRNDPVVITTLGQRPPFGQRGQRGLRPQGPRLGLAAAVMTGLALLFVYAVVSLIFHVVAATILWLPAIIAAGYAAGFAARRGIHGLPRLAIGIVVLIAVRAVLLSL